MKNLRIYGQKPYTVAVVHGGPGAPGEVAPVARELSSRWGILEPLQTKDSIDGQIAELASVLREKAALPVTLIGWSWGATLSYMLAACHPALVMKLILIGTPAFEVNHRNDVFTERLNRLSGEERAEVFSLEEFIWDGADEDKSASLGRLFRLFAKADAYDPLPHPEEVLEYQLDINIAVGLEARRLTANGELLEMGKKITCPVVAIHGDYDSHLADGIKEPLSRTLKDFRFILLEKCGHEPWLEKYARDKFYELLRKEIAHGSSNG